MSNNSINPLSNNQNVQVNRPDFQDTGFDTSGLETQHENLTGQIQNIRGDGKTNSLIRLNLGSQTKLGINRGRPLTTKPPRKPPTKPPAKPSSPSKPRPRPSITEPPILVGKADLNSDGKIDYMDVILAWKGKTGSWEIIDNDPSKQELLNKIKKLSEMMIYASKYPSYHMPSPEEMEAPEELFKALAEYTGVPVTEQGKRKMWNFFASIIARPLPPIKPLPQPDPSTLSDQEVETIKNNLIDTISNAESFDSIQGEATRQFTLEVLRKYFLHPSPPNTMQMARPFTDEEIKQALKDPSEWNKAKESFIRDMKRGSIENLKNILQNDPDLLSEILGHKPMTKPSIDSEDSNLLNSLFNKAIQINGYDPNTRGSLFDLLTKLAGQDPDGSKMDTLDKFFFEATYSRKKVDLNGDGKFDYLDALEAWKNPEEAMKKIKEAKPGPMPDPRPIHVDLKPIPVPVDPNEQLRNKIIGILSNHNKTESERRENLFFALEELTGIKTSEEKVGYINRFLDFLRSGNRVNPEFAGLMEDPYRGIIQLWTNPKLMPSYIEADKTIQNIFSDMLIKANGEFDKLDKGDLDKFLSALVKVTGQGDSKSVSQKVLSELEKYFKQILIGTAKDLNGDRVIDYNDIVSKWTSIVKAQQEQSNTSGFDLNAFLSNFGIKI